jgi:hypothetical protein
VLVENVKPGKHIMELKPVYSICIQSGPLRIAVMGEEDINCTNFTMGWSFLKKLFVMTGGSYKHEFHRIVFLPEGGPNHISDYNAEVEYP